MGNAFDKEKESSGHQVREQEVHFSKKESDAINALFGRITASLAGKAEASSKPLMVSKLQRYLFLSGALKTREKFTEFLEHSMRMNGFQTIATMWELVKFGDDNNAGRIVPSISGFERLRRFLELLVELSYQRPESDDTIRAVTAEVDLLTKAVLADKTNAPESMTDTEASLALRSWCSSNGPCVAKVFVSYLSDLCFPDDKHPSFHPYKAPRFVGDHAESVLLPGGACDLIPLSLYSDKLQGDYRRLYSTMVDGRSFATMTHHIMGYDGPVCILIKPAGRENTVFGAFTTTKWREFNRFYGNGDAFLFTLRPELKIMRRRDRSNEHYQWLNMHAFGTPHGIGLGGTEDGYRIFIPDSFEKCRASDSCLTFECGALMPDMSTTESEKWSSGKYEFEIDQLEVWACGGPEAIKHGMQVQEHERALREENIQKARTVDKAQFLNNDFDKEFLLSKTFAHKAQIDRDHTDA